MNRTRLAIAATLLASCGSDASSTSPRRGSDATLRIEPASATTDVKLGEAPPTLRFRAFLDDEDVTAQVSWAIDDARLGSVSAGAVVANGIGGHGTVRAKLDDRDATAAIALKLTGSSSLDGAIAFDGPVTDTSLVIEYPPDGVVIPGNFPPLEFQIAPAPTTFRARLTSSDVLDVSFYSTQPALMPGADVWSRIGASAPDAPIALTMTSADGHASAPRTMTITNERIEQGAVYAHQCETGGLVVVDFLAATMRRLATQAPSNAASEQRIGHCAGCHDVSHDGRRIAFGFLDVARTDPPPERGPFYGGLKFDNSQNQFVEVIPPGPAIAVDTAFNPREAETRPAMMTAFAIFSEAISSIVMLDPETGKAIPGDNLADVLAAIPDEVGHGATAPAWSNHGDRIIFSAFPSPDGTQHMEPKQGSLVETAVSYDGTNFHFGPPSILVRATGPTDTNARATFEDDDVAFAFTHVTNNVGTVVVQRHSDGAILPLAAGAAEPGGAWDTRLAAWGAASGPKYSWIVVASNRPYGHRSTHAPNPPGNTANRYQLWMFAVDRARLAAGTIDPSSPALWLPGQNLEEELTHPQWPRAMLSR